MKKILLIGLVMTAVASIIVVNLYSSKPKPIY